MIRDKARLSKTSAKRGENSKSINKYKDKNKNKKSIYGGKGKLRAGPFFISYFPDWCFISPPVSAIWTLN